MHAILGNGAGGFECGHHAKPTFTDMRAGALQSAARKIDLNRLAHFQQNALDIDFMPWRKTCLGELHDHQRISTLIVFHRALSDLHGRLNGLARLGRYRLDLPACGPDDHCIGGMDLCSAQQQEQAQAWHGTSVVRKDHDRVAKTVDRKF